MEEIEQLEKDISNYIKSINKSKNNHMIESLKAIILDYRKVIEKDKEQIIELNRKIFALNFGKKMDEIG